MTNQQGAPEALRLAHIFDHPLPPEWPDMVAAAAELRRQHARIAELEAELEAVVAGGVQALSAAPAGWKLVPVEPTQEMLDSPPNAWPADAKVTWDAMLAASPTPPAEQHMDPDGEAFRKAARLGLTLRFYGACAQSSMPGTPSAYVVTHGGDRAEAMREAVEKAAAIIASGGEAPKAPLAPPAEQQACDTPNYCSSVQRCTAQDEARQQAAPKAAQSDYEVRGRLAASLKCWHRLTGEEAAELVSMYQGLAAPQQEAQEPALFVSAKQLADFVDPSHATGGSYLPARKTRAGLFTQPLYTAPQPAPAPLSDDAKDAARYRWLRTQDNEDFEFAVVKNPHFDVFDSPEELDAAIDAAIAAQGDTP